MKTHYSEAEVQQRLTFLPDWQFRQNALYRKFVFADFVEAFQFITAVALTAEKTNHHPDWSNSYATVEVSLTTHDAGGVTDKDFQLAATCDRLAI
ncbi:MAG: 4a-hydroxytetrahydrobiopterin dehydratase [Bacteroidetes bacterium]|nr:4a-hydroxytetrahydrobiopterin dehydratase [Bacteroidota bacterium]